MRSPVFLVAFEVTGISHADEPVTSTQATFDRIATLAGEWEGTSASGNHHRVSYELIANGSVIVENWVMSPTRRSMTVYATDGDRILATHYCPQGNQPRMIFEKKDGDGRYCFGFLDGTNLQDSGGSHQHAFWLHFDSPDAYTRSETYVGNARTDAVDVEEGAAVTYRRKSSTR